MSITPEHDRDLAEQIVRGRGEPKTWPCLLLGEWSGRHVDGPCRAARRNRPERAAWDTAARQMEPGTRWMLDGVGPVFRSKPYLVAHPDREIAEIEWIGRFPYAECRACGLVLGMRFEGDLARAADAAVHHNRTHHPRRAERLYNLG